jgi:type VII secretion integral membrane protein EccD
VPTAYSRVTVVNGARRVDLALPSALPLAELMPQLLGYCAPDSPPDRPVGWVLAPLGGGPLSLSGTLAECGVADGDVLELRTAYDSVHPAHVEDVRDLLEDTMDEAAQQWRPRATVSFALATAGVGLTLMAALPQVWEPREAGSLGGAALLVALLVLATWWAARRGHHLLAQLLAAVAGWWAAVAGWLAATYPQWPVAAMVGSAVLAALLVTALIRALTPVATGQLAALSLLAAAAAGVGVSALAGADPMAGVRVVAIAAVLLVGVLPRASLTVGGLASADYRVRNHGLLTGEELALRIAQSSALLYGSVVSAAVIGLLCGVLLAVNGAGWDRLLGTALGLALVLRSRVFSRIPQIVPLRVAGLGVLGVQAVSAAVQLPALVPWLVPIAAAAALLMVALSAVPLSDVARARVKQLLNRAETVVVIAAFALAAAALGVFDWVARLTPS